jgi:hypothetical protein
LALADCANDEGLCWPGIRSLCRKTGKGERSLQGALLSLEKGGHIFRDERPGKGMIYTVHPQATLPLTPAKSAPRKICAPQKTAQTPAKSAGKPSVTVRDETVVSSKRGSRLSSDWVPSPSDLEFASDKGFARKDALALADEFRDYWLALPGQRGVKLDWSATWRNWVRKAAAMPKAKRAPAFVSDSGFEYRGSLAEIARQAEKRRDNDTYWRAKRAMSDEQEARPAGDLIDKIVRKGLSASA